MKVAFDIGGVLSKYPEVFLPLMKHLALGGAEVYVLSDMHPVEKIHKMIAMNNVPVAPDHCISASYTEHGELCKTKVCDALGIDVLIDDFIGYVAAGKHVRLLVMPDPEKTYYHDDWKTDGSEGDFGRRKASKI